MCLDSLKIEITPSIENIEKLRKFVSEATKARLRNRICEFTRVLFSDMVDKIEFEWESEYDDEGGSYFRATHLRYLTEKDNECILFDPKDYASKIRPLLEQIRTCEFYLDLCDDEIKSAKEAAKDYEDLGDFWENGGFEDLKDTLLNGVFELGTLVAAVCKDEDPDCCSVVNLSDESAEMPTLNLNELELRVIDCGG